MDALFTFFAELIAEPWFKPGLVAAGIAMATAGFGAGVTELGPWYRSLKQPRWKPPDWAFPVVWTSIFGLCTVAGVLAWMAADTPGWQRCVLAMFLLNAVLNGLWSVLYFRWQRPDWSLIEVVALWLSVAALVLGLWALSPLASVLVLPYLVWVTIAGALNLATVRLNGPFEGRPRKEAAA